MRQWAARQVVRFKWHLILVALIIAVGYVLALQFLLPTVTLDQVSMFLAIQGVILLLVQIAQMIEDDNDRRQAVGDDADDDGPPPPIDDLIR